MIHCIPAYALLITVALFAARPATANDFERGLAALEQGYAQIALELWRPLAESGDAEAQFALGVVYNDAMGVPQDYAEANYWFLRAAEQNYQPAQYNLGNAYKYGTGMQRDDTMAVIWWRKAAEAGFAPAQYNLGSSYLEGSGVAPDRQEGLKWYQRAADNGHLLAKEHLEREGITRGPANPLSGSVAQAQSTTSRPHTPAAPPKAAEPSEPATPPAAASPPPATPVKAAPATQPPATPARAESPVPAAPNSTTNSINSSDPCQRWLAAGGENDYTLQLMAVREAASADEFLRRNPLKPAPVICAYPTSDGILHAILYGYYPTAKAARKALAELPDNLRSGGPYLRRLQVLRHATTRDID